MVYKPPLSPGPFENWLSSSSSPSPPSSRPSFRSFVHPARGVTHHPSPPLSSSLLLEHGLLSRGYPRITGQPRNGFPSSPPLNGENRGKDASCVCARARVYVCVCWWRRSSLATIDEVKVESWNRRILPCFSGIDRSKGVSGVSS